jgi:hypothetical protein
MTQNGQVVIGDNGADHVSLKIMGRDREGWSRAEIEVRCDGWTGKVKGDFMKGELARFADEIRRLHRDLIGTAQLQPLEPNISLTLAGDGKGHIAVDGSAQNSFGSGTRLVFRFTIDQTYLKEIADSLSEADPS